MAGNIARSARRIWSCCPPAARNAISEASACPSSSTLNSAVPRPSLRNPSASGQPPLLGASQRGLRRTHYESRLPGEIGAVASLIPRHNATAAARLVSKLSSDLTLEIEGVRLGHFLCFVLSFLRNTQKVIYGLSLLSWIVFSQL
jgi:hypothetical protein